ncbi:MAG: hypothetical protein GWO08_06485, partial [Gammaproteobacteria bacterium]|nr:hypothetical protein [Gammaproteobacteria bacterium]NIW47286.1 hypothetical protein [Gammaproteobacteria bacterium]NIX58210.1 hypothetical protein [candidate division Zixibacteria bacterium]
DDVLIDEAQPDLAVTQFIGLPPFALGSSTVNFDVEVSNVGASPTPGTTLDISLNGSPSSSHSVSALTSGQSDTISTSITTSASGTDMVTAALQAIPNDADLSNDTLSANIAVLSPIPLPFTEMWDTTVFDTAVWLEVTGTTEIIDTNGVATGTFPYPVPSPPYFLSMNDENNILASGIFDLSGATNYALMMQESEHDLEIGESVFLEYLASDGSWKLLNEFPGTNNGFGTFEPFEQMMFSLPGDAYHSGFRFRYRTGSGLSTSDEWFFDDIQLMSVVLHDFAVDSLDVNACLVAGVTDTVTARVTNAGNQPETGVTIELREDGVFAGDAIIDLNPGESATVMF